jgi:hypothetical protein
MRCAAPSPSEKGRTPVVDRDEVRAHLAANRSRAVPFFARRANKPSTSATHQISGDRNLQPKFPAESATYSQRWLSAHNPTATLKSPMISIAKLHANQANAQYSTGPKTGQGKARSAANSRTHGLCSQEVLVADEDHAEFESMHVGLLISIGPRGELEQTLFDELVRAAWNLRRAGRMETELCAGADSYTALLDDEALQKKLDRLSRHHTRIERTFHRSLKELKALQTSRAQTEALSAAEQLDRPPLAAFKPISKRTQPPAQPAAPEEAADPEFDEHCAEMNRRAAELFAKVHTEPRQ